MKQRLWVPLVAVGLALAILVPTTFAVGEPGTTLYAQLGTNRFPGGQGSADAQLRFNSENNIVLQIAIAGPAGTNNAVRVYVDGTCANPGIWVINRTPTAGQNGPFLEVASNGPPTTIQVNPLDVARIRSELADNPNETFALMVARLINGQNYRTCTTFRSTPFPPLTTTSATSPTTTGTTTNTTRFTTRTTTITSGTLTFTSTITEPVTTSTVSTRLSTVFSTGTTLQTVTLTSGLTTVTLSPTATTQTLSTLSTGLSTGTTTFFTNVPPFITSSTFTTPVTQTITSIVTTTVPGGTVTTQSGVTTFTTTGIFTTPVTTVTTTL